MRHLRQAGALLLALLMTMLLCVPALAEAPAEPVTILFTHDLHSHLLPAEDEQGRSYGGYARLKTAIDRQKQAHPGAILLDGGDFTMGSLFQTSFLTSAVELRAMGQLGYDVTTFGNHEFDYGPGGLARMLRAAMDSGDPLPLLVEANYLPAEGDNSEGVAALREAMADYGVADYVLLERGGVWFAVLGIFGIDADDCSPTSGLTLADRIEAAQRVVDAARADCQSRHGVQPLVVCLSHSGTDGSKGEDYDLAKQVTGIDVIVSGHTHETLYQPITVGSTWIVSAGEYAKNLGVLALNRQPDGQLELADYQLVPIDDTLPEDPALSAAIAEYKQEVDEDYLSRFGMEFDQVLAENPYRFDSVKDVYATAHESPLCNLFSDAYKWAVEQVTGEPVDMALTASGVIRESLPQGSVTVSQVFNAASLGAGADDVPGGALLSIYLTGSDLKNVLEVDASVYPIMPAAQLFCSGVEYHINTDRMIFNKVDYAVLRRPDGTTEPIENDRLYRVVTGTYAGNMLGSVKEKSFGLLSVIPRTADGTPIDLTRLTDYIVHNDDGSELKEWYAIATYLQSMGGEVDARYGAVDGRKVVYASLSPAAMLRNANRFTYAALALIVLVLLVVALIVRRIVTRRARRANKQNHKGETT